MAVGTITTIAACFPALVMKLLEFVALYGLVLMPMGAIIMMDVYLIPKMGLKQNFAETFKKSFSVSAAFAWIATLLISVLINQVYGLEIFFLGLPGWFIAAALYIISSRIIQGSQKVRSV